MTPIALKVQRTLSAIECLLHDEDVIDNHVNESIHIDNQVKNPSGTQLRSYRLALAATGEYTSFHGGTVNAAMAAIVTSVNRVVGVYEDEVGVTMVLVANNNLIVYTNSSTDPYTNNDGYAMLAHWFSKLRYWARIQYRWRRYCRFGCAVCERAKSSWSYR